MTDLETIKARFPETVQNLAIAAERHAETDRTLGPQRFVTFALRKMEGVHQMARAVLGEDEAWDLWRLINYEMARLASIHWTDWDCSVVETEDQLDLRLMRKVYLG